MSDTPTKPRKTLVVAKRPADAAGARDTGDAQVRSGPRARVAAQRAKEDRAAERPASRPARQSADAPQPQRRNADAPRQTGDASRPARRTADAPRPMRQAHDAPRPARQSADAAKPPRRTSDAPRPPRPAHDAPRMPRQSADAPRPPRPSAGASKPRRQPADTPNAARRPSAPSGAQRPRAERGTEPAAARAPAHDRLDAPLAPVHVSTGPDTRPSAKPAEAGRAAHADSARKDARTQSPARAEIAHRPASAAAPTHAEPDSVPRADWRSAPLDENEIPPSQRRGPRKPETEREGRPDRGPRARRDAPEGERAPARSGARRPTPAPAQPAAALPAGLYRWFAPCPRGLEQPLAQELAAFGASDVRIVPGGCQFTGPLEAGWRANLHSRIASRVLRELTQSAYRDEQDLYDTAYALDWPALFSPERTLKVEIVGVHAPVRSLEFVTLRVKDAICDRMRDATGRRPDIDTRTPDVRVHAFLSETVATFYLDTSGEALFKRGWRHDKVEAPLRENLAAGLLALAGWTPGTPLLDPFCGSGTIPIEAALIARRQAPGFARHFGFEHLNEFNAARWEALREEAQAAIDPAPTEHIYASDISINAVPIARANAEHAGVQIALYQIDARELQPPCEQPGFVVCNPPYGERVHVRGKAPQAREQAAGGQDDDAAFFAEFAAMLKRRFAGWKVAILSSDPELPSKMRLKPARSWPLYNGALACRLFVFEIVAGSNRK